MFCTLSFASLLPIPRRSTCTRRCMWVYLGLFFFYLSPPRAQFYKYMGFWFPVSFSFYKFDALLAWMRSSSSFCCLCFCCLRELGTLVFHFSTFLFSVYFSHFACWIYMCFNFSLQFYFVVLTLSFIDLHMTLLIFYIHDLF